MPVMKPAGFCVHNCDLSLNCYCAIAASTSQFYTSLLYQESSSAVLLHVRFTAVVVT
jgi:hypothetical protein